MENKTLRLILVFAGLSCALFAGIAMQSYIRGQADEDKDGASASRDCDDHDPRRFPGAIEGCDGIDNDCNGIVPDIEADHDRDGVRACMGDCDDTNPKVHRRALEIEGNGIDEDCDGRDRPIRRPERTSLDPDDPTFLLHEP